MKYRVKIDVDPNEYRTDADGVRSLLRLQFLLEELLDELTPRQSENLDTVLETFCPNQRLELMIKRIEHHRE